MNKKKILSCIIASTLVFSFVGGCSSNNKATDNSSVDSSVLSEKEKEKEREKEKKLEAKYVGMLNEDASNKYDVAIKYLKEQHNVDAIPYDSSDVGIPSQEGVNKKATLKLANDEDVIFYVYMSTLYDSIYTDLYTCYVSHYGNIALSDKVNGLLPEGSEIIAEFNFNGEKNLESINIKGKSIEDILSNENIFVSDIGLAIKTPNKVEDYNVYKENILNALNVTKLKHKGMWKLAVKIMFTPEDNFATKYCEVFEASQMDLLDDWYNPVMDIRSSYGKTDEQKDLHSKINAFTRLELSYEPEEMVSEFNELDLNSGLYYDKYK